MDKFHLSHVSSVASALVLGQDRQSSGDELYFSRVFKSEVQDKPKTRMWSPPRVETVGEKNTAWWLHRWEQAMSHIRSSTRIVSRSLVHRAGLKPFKSRTMLKLADSNTMVCVVWERGALDYDILISQTVAVTTGLSIFVHDNRRKAVWPH